jgi:probable rRNA maturation factor
MTGAGGGGSTRRRPSRPTPAARYAIGVRNEQTHFSVPAGRIRRIARLALAAEQVAAAMISVALVDNRAIHCLNRRHLNHDYETDVLSFLFESEPGTAGTAEGPGQPRAAGRRIDGEIVISAEMALQAAPRFGWSPAEEFALYLVHGLLHLCDYDDTTDAERRLMKQRERAILNLLGPNLVGD